MRHRALNPFSHSFAMSTNASSSLIARAETAAELKDETHQESVMTSYYFLLAVGGVFLLFFALEAPLLWTRFKNRKDILKGHLLTRRSGLVDAGISSEEPSSTWMVLESQQKSGEPIITHLPKTDYSKGPKSPVSKFTYPPLKRKGSWQSLQSINSDDTFEAAFEHELGYGAEVQIIHAAVVDDSRLPKHSSNLMSLVPMCNKIFLSSPFPMFPDLTVAHLLILTSYAALCFTATLYNSPLSFDLAKYPGGVDTYRSADIALAQLPVVISLGARNSVFKLIFANGRDQIMVKLHKFAGRVMFLGAMFHTGLYVKKFVIAGTFFSSSSEPYMIGGWIGTGGFVLIVATSIPYFRSAFHRFFKICHWIGIGLFIGGMYYHVNPARYPYIYSGLAVLGFDTILKCLKTRLTTVEMKAIPEAQTVILTFPNIRGGWRAGQYVMLRVPAVARVAGMQAFEMHPFTIGSAPGRNGLVLMSKVAGDWTKALFDLTQRNQLGHHELGVVPYTTKAILEGPYGGLGNENLSSFSSVVLVAGGSGITSPLAFAQDLLDKAARGEGVRARTIEFVFIVRTQEIARPFVPMLMDLVEKAKHQEMRNPNGNFTAIRIHLFITRSPASSPIDLKLAHKSSVQTLVESNYSGIEIIPKRPDMDAILNDALDAAIRCHRRTSTDTKGCAVVVCGPGPVVSTVRAAVAYVDERKRMQMGGIELLEEGFML